MDTVDTKVSNNRQKKVTIVEEIAEKLGKTKAIVFTNYQGVTHKQLESLKRAIKPMDAEYVVAKNTLVLRALEKASVKTEGDNLLEGPTGTLLVYGDVVGPLKELAKLIKELGIPSVKFGIMDNKTYTGEQVLKISTLPSREVLLTQIAAGLKSPISSLHRALSWNIQKLVLTLNAVAGAKPALAIAATPQPEPVAAPEPVVEAKTEPEQAPTEEQPAPTDETPNEEPKNEGGEN